MTARKTYLIFWNVEGVPETIDDLLKVKADTRTSLGNLVCRTHYDDEDARHSLYSLSVAKYYNCQILKGENEKSCIEQRLFPHKMVKEELRQLPISIENDGLVFLSNLPIPPTSDDEKIIKEKLKKLNKPISHLTDEELSEAYGRLISKNIDNLQYTHPRGEIFFVGGRMECAVWQRVISTVRPVGVYDILGETDGSKELELTNSSICIVSPGDANEGYYCTLTLPEKKLTV